MDPLHGPPAGVQHHGGGQGQGEPVHGAGGEEPALPGLVGQLAHQDGVGRALEAGETVQNGLGAVDGTSAAQEQDGRMELLDQRGQLVLGAGLQVEPKVLHHLLDALRVGVPEAHGQEGGPGPRPAQQRPVQEGAQGQEQAVDGGVGVDEPVPVHLRQTGPVRRGGGMFQDDEDGQVPEQAAGFRPQQVAQPVAVQGIAARVHQHQVRAVPGLRGQGVQEAGLLLDAVPRPLERGAEAFEQHRVPGDGKQVHGRPRGRLTGRNLYRYRFIPPDLVPPASVRSRWRPCSPTRRR